VSAARLNLLDQLYAKVGSRSGLTSTGEQLLAARDAGRGGLREI
jgi:hypothetical protein